ncbi:MAG: SOS response-associated peptidase [Gammaproteobacteria bacterium]|nr:SOS response-associated peptidase [Gammaproteobacteria bacterium]MCP5298462.1 SOS response-associated peptidase [Chromatiaceae bacterium]
MCGRYFLHSTADRLTQLFGEMPMPLLQPRFNIAPSQPVPVVRQDANRQRQMVLLRWGLVPGWSKGPDPRYSMINARAETVATKPAYRNAFRYRRCLIPADGFYEWRAADGAKQPFVLRPRDRAPLALAGLWEHWHDDQGNELESCAIIVREATGQVREVHDRMPVVIAPRSFDLWLDVNAQKPSPIETLMAAQQMPDLDIYPVSRAVNSPRNDVPDLLDPVEAGT